MSPDTVTVTLHTPLTILSFLTDTSELQATQVKVQAHYTSGSEAAANRRGCVKVCYTKQNENQNWYICLVFPVPACPLQILHYEIRPVTAFDFKKHLNDSVLCQILFRMLSSTWSPVIW